MPLSLRRREPKHKRPSALRFAIRRSSLLQRLDEAEDSRLIVVEGPSGYGKTTLLGQFARESRRPVAWLTLTPDDVETQTLCRSVAIAVRYALPDLPLERWEKAAAFRAGAERLASSLAGDLNLADENLVLILEGLEHLGADACLWMNAFLRSLGEGHQVIVSQYGDESAIFKPHIDANEVTKLGASDLAFTVEECREFLELVDSDLDPTTAVETLGGWPAALGMTAHSAALSASSTDLVLNILNRLPAGLREALPEAAVLETWDEETARKIGCVLPDTWLAKARRCGLPMTPLGDGTYQPHRIVLGVLEQLLLQRPERHAALHLAAARHAETNGQLLFAIEHLRVGGHIGEALRLIEELLPRWEWRSDWMLVRRVLEPFAYGSLCSRLKTALGVALLETLEPTRSEVILREQVGVGKASGWTHFGLSILAYRRGDYEATLEHAREGLALARDQRMVILLLQSKVVGLIGLDKSEEGLEAARECLKRAEALGDPSLLVRALSIFQYATRINGDDVASLALGRRALDLAFTAGVPNRALTAVIEISGHHYHKGQADEALPLIEKMLSIGTTEYPLAVPFMRQCLGYVHKQQARFEVACGHFESAAELFEKGGSTLNVGNISTEVIYCLLRLGQLERAEVLLPTAGSFLLAGTGDERAIYYVAEGLVRFYQGRLDAAKDAFERQDKEQRKGSQVEFDEIIARAYLAEIARRQRTLSYQQVSAFITELDRMGHDWPLGVEAEPLRGLYEECVHRGWFVERFRPYLGPVPRRELASRPVLELTTLGCFRATLNGNEVLTTPKTRELLVYLALHGPRRTHEAADALWGHMNLKCARNNLKTQMRLLRIALEGALGKPGSDVVTWDKSQGSYGLASTVEVRLDTHALEIASRHSRYDTQLAALQHYQGEFMPGCESEWVIEAQGRYRDMAMTLCLSLAAQAEEVDIAAAIGLYRQAIDIDFLVEEAHHGLISLYELEGNVTAVRLAREALEQVRRENDPERLRREAN